MGHVLDQFVLVTPHVSLGPQLSDISNNQHSKHITHASGPKWSRVLRSSHGSKEALLSLAGQKRGFGVDSVQLELSNKKFQVFQDDKENSVDMAEAGS